MNLLPTNEPLLITQEAFAELAALPIPQHIATALQGREQAKNGPSYKVNHGLATIQLRGSMHREVNSFNRRVMDFFDMGYTDMSETAQAIRAATRDGSVKAILLNIDSPGGTVNGTPELAAAVRSASREKQTYAYTAGLACSAAYWVASQCDAIYAAPSARVGSIGVILPLLDSSGYLAKNGMQMDVIAAGKYKSTGLSGTTLSVEQRALLQQQVETTWAEFKEAVTKRRRISPENMEGQTFSGKEARSLGLVDACCPDLAGMERKLILRHGMPDSFS